MMNGWMDGYIIIDLFHLDLIYFVVAAAPSDYTDVEESGECESTVE